MTAGPTTLSVLRKIKHVGFVAYKRTKPRIRAAKYRLVTEIANHYAVRRPYVFEPSRYRRSYLVRPSPALSSESMLPRRVFVVWTGRNPMPETRARNLGRLRETIGLPVELVTPANLDEWLVPGHPLHPGYEFLSLTHRSDYLRAYLLHHHGGGYCDVKRPLSSWLQTFDHLEAQDDLWVAGYPEVSAGAAVRLPGALGVDIALNYRRLIGNGALLARSHTPLTAEWLREVERRLSYYEPQMREFPGGVRGQVVGYPISWTRLIGIFQPLQLKYLDRVHSDTRMLLDFHDYQ